MVGQLEKTILGFKDPFLKQTSCLVQKYIIESGTRLNSFKKALLDEKIKRFFSISGKALCLGKMSGVKELL